MIAADGIWRKVEEVVAFACRRRRFSWLENATVLPYLVLMDIADMAILIPNVSRSICCVCVDLFKATTAPVRREIATARV